VLEGDGNHPIEVAEIDDFAGVGLGETGSGGVPVHRDHPKPEAPSLLDRAALVPAGADEEDGSRHGRRC
jgi:hypothetical protein